MSTSFEADTKTQMHRHRDQGDDINTISNGDWQLWCRLCAKEDPEGNVSILWRDGEALDDEVAIANSNLSYAIGKYFSVEISCDDNLPKMLCTECFSLITSLVNFTERVDKVQQMLLTLQENLENSKRVNLDAIRQKYGLLDEDRENDFNQPVSEILFLEMNNKGERCESDIVNSLKLNHVEMREEVLSEELEDDNDDDVGDGVDNLGESLMDVPSLTTIKPRRSKRNTNKKKKKKQKSDSSLTKLSKKVPIKQKYICPHCSRVCKWKSDYEIHVLTHLPDEQKKRFPCPHCGKKFITNFRVTQHIRLAHMDDRPFACDKCEKKFKENRYLKQHMETHNPNKHICAKCGLQLNSLATLNRHLLTHSEERNHKCDYCGRAFKLSKNLKEHLLSHVNLRPYSCNFCNRSYNSASACRAHEKNAHPDELADMLATGVTKTTANVPSLEALKTIAKEASNLRYVPTKIRRHVKYRLKKIPKEVKDDDASETSVNTDYDYDVNPNRVRYTFAIQSAKF